jgi:hypothetical protein
MKKIAVLFLLCYLCSCTYEREIESDIRWITLVKVEEAPDQEHPDRVKMIWKRIDGVQRVTFRENGTNLKPGFQMWALIDK